MDGQDDLTITAASVSADGPTYLDDYYHWVHVEFQNNTGGTIEITRTACSFETEVGHPKHMATSSRHCTILPGKRQRVKIPFQVNLTIMAKTNQPSIEVEYVAGGSARVVESEKLFTPSAMCHICWRCNMMLPKGFTDNGPRGAALHAIWAQADTQRRPRL